MKPKIKNPITKQKIKCSEKGCKNYAVMFRCKIPFCKEHAPYLQKNKLKGGMDR